jgi:hypothetical protein
VNMKDDLYGTLIEPGFYSVLKEYGYPSARFTNGKYKDTQTHAMWIAYLCGKTQEGAQQIMAHYPDCQEQPHES